MSSLLKKMIPQKSVKLCSKPLSQNKTSVFFSTTILINQKQSLENRFSSVKTYSSNKFNKPMVHFGSNTFFVSKNLISSRSRKSRTLKFRPFFAKPLNFAFSCYTKESAQKLSSEGSKGLRSMQHVALSRKKTSSSIKCKSFSSFANYLKKKENIMKNLEGYKLQKQSTKYQIPIRNVCKIFIIYVCGSFCWLYLITYSNSKKSFFTGQKFNFLFQEIVFKNLPLFQKSDKFFSKETLDNITLNRNDKNHFFKDKTSFINVERNGTLVNLQLSSFFRDFSTQNYRGSVTQILDNKKEFALVQTQSLCPNLNVSQQSALHEAHKVIAPTKSEKGIVIDQQKDKGSRVIPISIESSDIGKIQGNSSKIFKEMQKSNLLKKRFIFLNKKSYSNNLYYSKTKLNNKSSRAKETNLFFQEKNIIPMPYRNPKTPDLAFFARKPLFISSNLAPISRYPCAVTEYPKSGGSPFQQNQILSQKEQYFYSGTSLVMSPDFDFFPKKLEHINKKRSNRFSASINFLPKLEQIEKLKWCNYLNSFVTNSYLYTKINYNYTFNLSLGKILNKKGVEKKVNFNLKLINPQFSTSLFSGLRKIDLKLLKSCALFSSRNISTEALLEFEPKLILGVVDNSFNLNEIFKLLEYSTKEKNSVILKKQGKKLEEKKTEKFFLRKFLLSKLVGSKTTKGGKVFSETNQTKKKVINKERGSSSLYINSRLQSGFNFPDTFLINNVKRNKLLGGILLKIKKDNRSQNINYVIPTASISSLLESGKSRQEQNNKQLGELKHSDSFVQNAGPKSFEVNLSYSKSKGQKSFGWSFDTLGPKANSQDNRRNQSGVSKTSYIKILYEKKPIQEYISYKPNQKAKNLGNSSKVPMEVTDNVLSTSAQKVVQLKNKNITEFFAQSSANHFFELWKTSNTDVQKINSNQNEKNKKKFFSRSGQYYSHALQKISSVFWKNHNFAYFVILDKNADIKIKNYFFPNYIEKPQPNLKTKSSPQKFINEKSFHGLKNQNAPESFFGVPYLQLGERFTIEKIKGFSQIGTFYSVKSKSNFPNNIAFPFFPFASMGTSLKTIFGKKLLKQQPSKKIKTQNLVTNARLVSNWSVFHFAENKHKYNMFDNSLVSTFAKNNLFETKGFSSPEKQQDRLSFTEQTKNLLYFKRIAGFANSHLINPFKYYNPGTKRERNIEDTMLTLEGYKKSRLFPKIHVYYKGISCFALPINEKLYNTSENLDIDLQSILGGMRQRTEVERKAENFIQTRAFKNNLGQENNDNANFSALEQTSYDEAQKLKNRQRENVDSTEKTEQLKTVKGDKMQAPFLPEWNLDGTEKDLETRDFQDHDNMGFVFNKANQLQGQEQSFGPWEPQTEKTKVLSFERTRQKKRKSSKKKLRFTNCYPLRTILSVGSQTKFSQTLKPNNVSLPPDSSEYFFPSLSNCVSTKSKYQIKNSSETKGFYFEKLAKNNSLGVSLKRKSWPSFGLSSPWIKSPSDKRYNPNGLMEQSSINLFKISLPHLTTQMHFWNPGLMAGYFSKIIFFGIIWFSYKILASQLTHSTQFLPAVFTEAIGLQSFQKKYRIITPQKTNQSFKNLAGAEKTLAELRDLIWTFGLVGTGGPRGEHSYLSSFSYLGRTAGKRLYSVFSKDRNRFLLYGPPGTGKTLLVKALAKEANVPIIVQPVSQLRMITGVENPISTLFHVARQIKPCILFLDELDTLGNDVLSSSTGEQKGSNAQWANLARKYTYTLLLELDGLTSSTRDLLIIGATNRPETLNPALTRAGRFETIINCKLPSQKQRFSVLSLYLSFLNKKKLKTTKKAQKTEKTNQNFYLHYLAKKSYGLSQASIGTAVNESAMDSIFLNQSSSHRLKSLEKAIDSVKTLSSPPLNFSNFFVPVTNFNSFGSCPLGMGLGPKGRGPTGLPKGQGQDFAYKIVKNGPKLTKTFSNYNLNVKIWPFLVYMSYQTTGSLIVFSKLSKSNIVLKKSPQKQKNKVSNFTNNKIYRNKLLTRRALIRHNIISKRFSVNKNKTTDSKKKESTLSNYNQKQIFQINQSLKNKESRSPILNNKINFEISLYKRYAPIASTNLYSSIRPQSFKLSSRFGLYKNPTAFATNLLILNYLTTFVNSKYSSLRNFALSPLPEKSRFPFGLVMRDRSNSSSTFFGAGSPVQSKIKNIPVSKLSPQFISQNAFFRNHENNSKESNTNISTARYAKTSANSSLFKKNRENKNSFRFQEELYRQIKLSKPLTTSWFRIYLSRPIFRYEVGEYIENREYYPQNNYNLICQSLHFANLSFLAHRIYTPISLPQNNTQILQQKGETETFFIGQNLKKEVDEIPIELTLYLAIVASIFHKVSLFIGKNRELLDYSVYNNLRYGTLYDFSINQICKKF